MHPKKKMLLVNQEVQNIIPVSKMPSSWTSRRTTRCGHGARVAIGRVLMKQIEDLETSRAAFEGGVSWKSRTGQ